MGINLSPPSAKVPDDSSQRQTGVFLADVILPAANLTRASLAAANLIGANLIGANLSGVDLSSSRHLSQQQLEEACGNAHTKLPKGLTTQPCE